MSGFLLDTNIISELVKPKPEANVTEWVENTDESLLYLSVLTLGDIRRGSRLFLNRDEILDRFLKNPHSKSACR